MTVVAGPQVLLRTATGLTGQWEALNRSNRVPPHRLLNCEASTMEPDLTTAAADVVAYGLDLLNTQANIDRRATSMAADLFYFSIEARAVGLSDIATLSRELFGCSSDPSLADTEGAISVLRAKLEEAQTRLRHEGAPPDS